MERISTFVRSHFGLGNAVLFLGCIGFLLSKHFRIQCCEISIWYNDTMNVIGQLIARDARRVSRFFRRHTYIRNGGLIVGGFCAAVALTGASVVPNIIIFSTEHPKETVTIKTETKSVYTKEEEHLMIMAYRIGRELASAPETIQAILLVETYAGRYGDRVGDRHLPTGKRSYGVMQVKVATARKVLKSYPEMINKYFDEENIGDVADEEIIAKLLSDDEFCIRVGTLNFVLEKKLANNDWTKGVVAYNTGSLGLKSVSDPATFGYTQKIKQKIDRDIKPFNKQNGLGK